VKLIESLKIYF